MLLGIFNVTNTIITVNKVILMAALVASSYKASYFKTTPLHYTVKAL
jgi:general stress protein CsbA